MKDASFQQTTELLFSAVLGVLVLASAVGGLLKWRVARGQGHGVIDNLNSRIKAWWVMVLLVSLSFAFGKAGVMLLSGFMSFTALREYITLAYTRAGDHLALALMFYVALPLQYYLIWIEWYGLYSIFIPVHVFLVLPILSSLSGDTNCFLERASKMQWGLMICVYCLSHLPALLTLEIPRFEGRNLLLIVYLIMVVQGSDVLQYVWGKLLGERKIAPELSPSKTNSFTSFPRSDWTMI